MNKLKGCQYIKRFMLEEMKKWNKLKETYGKSEKKCYMLGEKFLPCGRILSKLFGYISLFILYLKNNVIPVRKSGL